VTYPNATSTYMYDIGDGSQLVLVGYVFTPRGESGYWGTVDNQGLWSLITRHVHELDCSTPTHELLGYDSNMVAVGFYNSPISGNGSICSIHPWKVKPGDDTIPLSVPGNWVNAEATGVAANGSGDDIVGSTSFASSSAAPAGWFFNAATSSYSTYHCCSASGTYPTTFNGIVRTSASAPNDLIVGSYTEDSKTHGFVFDETTGAWTYPIDAFQKDYTVVNGINANATICGWYSKSGTYYGFVAGLATIGTHR
jgi:hypothetical protein